MQLQGSLHIYKKPQISAGFTHPGHQMAYTNVNCRGQSVESFYQYPISILNTSMGLGAYKYLYISPLMFSFNLHTSSWYSKKRTSYFFSFDSRTSCCKRTLTRHLRFDYTNLYMADTTNNSAASGTTTTGAAARSPDGAVVDALLSHSRLFDTPLSTEPLLCLSPYSSDGISY